jgi:UDP-N-acetylmuramoyl-L-alanyl-D-glutamate--2,6-diaminopimelate ligase
MGLKAASMGTLGVTGGGFEEPGSLTTPDPVKLHKTLDALARAGVNHLAMEASSHGLEQHRLDGVKLTAAAFTNLTRDHLDYHGDAESYLYAKMRLFGEILRPGRAVVLNADECEALRDVEDLCWARGLRILTVGRAGDICLESSAPSARGQRLNVTFEGKRYEIDLPLIGGFQAMNALMAVGLAVVCGAEPATAFAALEHLVGVPGRLELVGYSPAGAPVFVDYAHTPDGLANVLAALRPHCGGKLGTGKLGVVFGCGGDRDAGKRPQMGEIAARMADRVWVTDDNPRTEDAAAIRRAILAACPGACEIGDRAEAIARAVESLAAGDVLVIAGKGHEQGQIVADQVLPFDDVVQVRGALAGVHDREGG